MPLSKQNRRGVVWVLILGVIVVSPRVFSALQSEDGPVISHEELAVVHAQFLEADIAEENDNESESITSKYSVPPTAFDPNTYTVNDWMNLGLSQRQSEVIINFSKRGLKSNADLEKIFVLPKELYALIKDSTIYPSYSQEVSTYEPAVFELVDLNSADPELLRTIPGIGEFYANKIVEHRTKLGGFVGKHQLLEIWKFDAKKLDDIDEFIVIEEKELDKININMATWKELVQHPYIESSVANSIVKMREQFEFNAIEDIRRSKLIDEELFVKIKPYLEL